MSLVKDQNKLLVYIEGRKRKQFVGELSYDSNGDVFIFHYDKKYLTGKGSIRLGPDIPLNKIKHESKGKLFLSFKDRIPSRNNPAYEDYCRQQGVSTKEKNPIILLATIGRRGPSSFIFEPAFFDEFELQKEIIKLRTELDLSQNDLALALNTTVLTLRSIEAGKMNDANIKSLMKIYLTNPSLFEDLLQDTGRRLHHVALQKIQNYLESKIVTAHKVNPFGDKS